MTVFPAARGHLSPFPGEKAGAPLCSDSLLQTCSLRVEELFRSAL